MNIQTFTATDQWLQVIAAQLGYGIITPVVMPSGLYTLDVILSAAQLKTLNSAPVQLLPALPAGQAYVGVTAAAKYYFNSVAFTNLTVRIKNANGLIFNATVPILDALQDASSNMTLTNATLDLITNLAVVIEANADSATGDGTLKVSMMYQIVNL